MHKLDFTSELLLNRQNATAHLYHCKNSIILTTKAHWSLTIGNITSNYLQIVKEQWKHVATSKVNKEKLKHDQLPYVGATKPNNEHTYWTEIVFKN